MRRAPYLLVARSQRAVSLGVSELERITGLAFDEQTVSADVATAASLSTTLGRESGEARGGRISLTNRPEGGRAVALWLPAR